MTKHSRRAILGAVTGLTLTGAITGCDTIVAGPRNAASPSPAGPDPLQALLDEAVTMAAAYGQIAVRQPGLAARLEPLAADHQVHVSALTKLIGPGAASSAPVVVASAPAGAASTVAGLRTAELSAQQTAVALSATIAAARAEIVGSIAACRATHAEALR